MSDLPANRIVSLSRALVRPLVRLPANLLLVLIRLYQLAVAPAFPVLFGPACGCRFHPTCSRYASEAVRTRGALVGTLLAARRLLRCHPLHPGGLDPVPVRPRCAAINPVRA